MFFIGDSLLDIYITGSVSRLNPEFKPCLVLEVEEGRESRFPGGGGNALRTLLAWGEDVTAVLFGIPLEEEFPGVSFYKTGGSLIKIRYIDEETGSVLLRVDTIQTRSVDDLSKAVEEVSIPSGEILALSDYGKGSGEFLVQMMVSGKVPEGTLIFVDPHPKTMGKMSVLENVVLKLNESEYETLLSISPNGDPFRWFSNLLAAVVTKGRKGVEVLDSRGRLVWKEEAPNVEGPIDPCGAGDVFFATLLANYRVDHFDLEHLIKACRVANQAAAYSVTKRFTSFLTPDEVGMFV